MAYLLLFSIRTIFCSSVVAFGLGLHTTFSLVLFRVLTMQRLFFLQPPLLLSGTSCVQTNCSCFVVSNCIRPRPPALLGMQSLSTSAFRWCIFAIVKNFWPLFLTRRDAKVYEKDDRTLCDAYWKWHPSNYGHCSTYLCSPIHVHQIIYCPNPRCLHQSVLNLQPKYESRTSWGIQHFP